MISFHKSGVSTLAIVLILSSMIVVMSIDLAMQSLEREKTMLHQTKLLEVTNTVEACMEEALLKLNGNHNYTGESFYFNDIFCIIGVEDLGNDERRISTLAHMEGLYAKEIIAEVDIAGAITILSWIAD